MQLGDTVNAFHPRMFGVVKCGTVTAIGRKYVHIDFGPMLGGTFKVLPQYVTDHIDANEGA